ncbi:MAG: DUF3021 family protein [Ruminococcaceae bacterium]|nr:DUF3021 family protein [Oscillospiraceae bacterium]
MEAKKQALLKCWVRALGAYTVINFLWTAILSIGTSAASEGGAESISMSGISAFAERLVMANAVIALFSVVFGFSFLVFEVKNMSQPAKRSLHVIINYIVSMICVYLLHSTAPEANAGTWIILIFFASIVYFAIYGIASLVAFLIKRNKTK